MTRLVGKIAWITGAGSGIGAASALALAGAGAEVVLSGRRAAKLTDIAARVSAAGGAAHVQAGDMSRAGEVEAIAAWIKTQFGRLDILVNNAGLNIVEREWANLTPAGVDEVIGANLASAFYCATAVLPMMRAQQGGLLIHTASMAGRFVSLLSGASYGAVKHGVVAMSHSLNMEECIHGIRSTALCPGEVATEILDRRPVPVSAEDRARMLQSEDCADLILYIAGLAPHVCINEVLITPTWNRGYVAALERRK